MAKKTRRPTPRKAKRKVKAAPRRKIVRRKKAKKPESTFEKFENALVVGAAEIDDIALGMGLLAASKLPRRKKR